MGKRFLPRAGRIKDVIGRSNFDGGVASWFNDQNPYRYDDEDEGLQEGKTKGDQADLQAVYPSGSRSHPGKDTNERDGYQQAKGDEDYLLGIRHELGNLAKDKQPATGAGGETNQHDQPGYKFEGFAVLEISLFI